MKKFWLPEHKQLLLIISTSFIPLIFMIAWQFINKENSVIPLGMEFVYIKPGAFIMGSPESEIGRDIDEHQHKVTLTEGYYIQTTEVTQRQWEALMGNNPSIFLDCGPNCPVENVSWNDVQSFLQTLNKKERGKKYRLPTEAEWEYACRAGTMGAFPFNNCLSTDQANYNGDYPIPNCPKGQNRKTTIPVGTLAHIPLGLFDMNGNVWEWCQDFYADYPIESNVTDPKGPESGSYKVIRGGSWKHEARKCRSACRNKVSQSYKNSNIGFRLIFIQK